MPRPGGTFLTVPRPSLVAGHDRPPTAPAAFWHPPVSLTRPPLAPPAARSPSSRFRRATVLYRKSTVPSASTFVANPAPQDKVSATPRTAPRHRTKREAAGRASRPQRSRRRSPDRSRSLAGNGCETRPKCLRPIALACPSGSPNHSNRSRGVSPIISLSKSSASNRFPRSAAALPQLLERTWTACWVTLSSASRPSPPSSLTRNARIVQSLPFFWVQTARDTEARPAA